MDEEAASLAVFDKTRRCVGKVVVGFEKEGEIVGVKHVLDGESSEVVW